MAFLLSIVITPLPMLLFLYVTKARAKPSESSE